MGRKGPFNPVEQSEDPTRSNLVREYIVFIRKEQGMSGVYSMGAKHMDRIKMDRLMENMRLEIRGMKRGARKLKMKGKGLCMVSVSQLSKDWQEQDM